MGKFFKSSKEASNRIWNFLKEDSWQSWIVSLVLVIIFIRFIFFPTLSLFTGSSLPLVIVESCSMYHESGFEDWWQRNGVWYEARGISKDDFESFSSKNGLNKGDILLLIGRGSYKKGDIIVFVPNSESAAIHPLIHRLIDEEPYGTKGDHNSDQLKIGNNPSKTDETNIPKGSIIGKTALRIPLLGWIKLVFFEPFRASGERGFC